MKVVLNDCNALCIEDDKGQVLLDRMDAEMRYPGPLYDTLYIY